MMEPWQMTEDEYRHLMYVGLPTKEKQSDIREVHKYLVQLALSEGKPVPPEVLKDYPDLAKSNPGDGRLLKVAIEREPLRVAKQWGYEVHRLSPKDVVDKDDYTRGYRYRLSKADPSQPYPQIVMARSEGEVATFLKRQVEGNPAAELVPELPNSMRTQKLIKIADPNIPLERLWTEETAYMNRLLADIREHGIREPIIVSVREDGSQMVWEGAHRLAVAQRLGITDIPVRYVGPQGNPVGTCYPDSWRYVMRHPEGVLVHGTIVGLRGRINHAWVELPDGTVWDPSAQAPMPTEKYYSLVDPIVGDRYTADEAAHMLSVGKHGPWTEEEKQRILGGNPMPRDYEGEPKWGVMVKRFEGKDYKYYMTEPTDKDIKKMRQKGYRVRVTTRDAVREMWVRMPLESEEGNPIILGGNPMPRTESERLSFHERIFGKGSVPPLTTLKRGMAVNKMLPMPPESGPPLPRALGLRWPWK